MPPAAGRPDVRETVEGILFGRTGLDPAEAHAALAWGLAGCDDGELFLEYRREETLELEDGRIRDCSFRLVQGFGLRAVHGEAVGYVHANDLTAPALARAAEAVRAVRGGHAGALALPPQPYRAALYGPEDPLGGWALANKIAVLHAIDAHLRRDPRVRQVTATLTGIWQVVRILRADGFAADDIRPLVRLNVAVEVAAAGRVETARFGGGGRQGYERVLAPEAWRAIAEQALRRGLVNLEAGPAPAGEMAVVMGSGWNGVLLHEAVGHGLEGDFIRKGTSTFAHRLGQRVAAPGVTVIDDGTLPGRRGSIQCDDEGTPSGRTVLIADGILVGFMQDRLNARLMGAAATGNGRRQSFEFGPVPRMTNTFMLPGATSPDEVVAAAGRGIYVASMSGGVVDETSGKFCFEANEAYRIEDGRIGRPVKGVTVMGNGGVVLTQVRMIGDDFALDTGVGNCGKAGQWVPVGVGQPTILVEGMTVGGTETP